MKEGLPNKEKDEEFLKRLETQENMSDSDRQRFDLIMQKLPTHKKDHMRRPKKEGAPLDINISGHAFNIFCKRYEEELNDLPRDPEATLKKIFTNAKEIERPNEYVQNIKHGKPARYFKSEGWTFVTDMDKKLVITVYRQKKWPRRK